jgi:DNA polymerase III subunit gamma/tau
VASLRKLDGKAHSFIFHGPSGVGKTTLARIMAARYIAGPLLPGNLIEVAVADNGSSDDMRRLIEITRCRAVGKSPVKAIILDEAHRLSGIAWDVLLKAIEEPPEHVYWFICTTNYGKIPKTIQTRCLRYVLQPCTEETLLELLIKVVDAEAFKVSDQVLEIIARAAEGSPRQALTYLEACQSAESVADAQYLMGSAEQVKEVIDLSRMLVKGKIDWIGCVRLIKEINADAESIRIQVVSYLAGCLTRASKENEARDLLKLMECFIKPYYPPDKLAPLLMSVGLALELDR